MKKHALLPLFTVGFLSLIFMGFKKDASNAFHSALLKSNVTVLTLTKHTRPTPVTITAVFNNFATMPWTGTFTTTGALEISGTASMSVEANKNGVRAHCVVLLTTEEGTITIHQECVFTTNPPKGQWQIVSGTGAYADLNGNGSLTMPPDTEAMEGVLY